MADSMSVDPSPAKAEGDAVHESWELQEMPSTCVGPTSVDAGDAVYESCALPEMPSTSVGPTSDKTDSPPKKIREDPVPTVLSSKHVVLMCCAIVFTMLGVIATLVFCVVSQARLQADLRMINITVSEARQTTHEDMLERSSRYIADLKKNQRDVRAGIMQEIADVNENLRDFESMTGNGFLRINESLNHINMRTDSKIADMNEHLRHFENMTANGFLRINESLNHINMRTDSKIANVNEHLRDFKSMTGNGFLRINESLNLINMSTENKIADMNEHHRDFENITGNGFSRINESLNYITIRTANKLIRITESLNDINMTTANDIACLNATQRLFGNTTANEIKDLKHRVRDTESSISLVKRRGVIEVHHDIPYEVEIHSANTYSVTPTYQITNESLTELLQKSSSCRQYIRIKCRGVTINHASRTYWVSREGEKMYNWGTDRDGYCPCGINDTCIDNRYQCNCDRYDFRTITSDGGYLTDKSKLPLHQIRFERMYSSSAAWLTVGNLECFAQDLEYRAKVRLSSGNDSSGRVEIQHDNLWGTICGDGWGWNESNVICRMLGFRYAHSFYTHGSGRGKIWLDDVSCTGSESTIVACQKSGLGVHNCTHDNDIGVICRNVVSARLVDGNDTSGRVELFLNGEWGSVCNDDWDLTEANIVCHMLSLGNASAADSAVENNGSISLDSVSCTGEEINIMECTHGGIGGHNCSDERRAGVVCRSVRLSSGTVSSGRVEISHGGEWGTICDDSWDRKDGHVICRMLGFSEALSVDTYRYHGRGRIWLDQVDCTGSETSIFECQKNNWGDHDCGHGEDAGVYCREY